MTPASHEHDHATPGDLLDVSALLDRLGEADAAASPRGLADRVYAGSVAGLTATPADLRATEARVDQLAAVYAASAPADLPARVHAATAAALAERAPLRLVGHAADARAQPRITVLRWAVGTGLALAAAVALVAGISVLMPPGRSGPAPRDDAFVDAALRAFDDIDAAVLGADVETLAYEADELAGLLDVDAPGTRAPTGSSGAL